MLDNRRIPLPSLNSLGTFEKSQKGSIVSAFFVGIVVGFGAYWIIIDQGFANKIFVYNTSEIIVSEETRQGSGTEITQEEPTTSRVLSLVAQGENILVVSDQPAGEEVIMSMVSLGLGQSGWVAIHEVDVDGAPSNILGARRFGAGKYFGEKIELLRGTREGEVYVAVLHADDGDSEFDYKREIPLEDLSGNLIISEFLATSNAGEE